MAIKLSKSQISALAQDIVDNFEKAETKNLNDSLNVISKDPKFIKHCKEQHNLLSKIEDTFLVGSCKKWSIKEVTDRLLNSHKNRYSTKNTWNIKTSVESKIILATIDCKTLEDLKKTVLKSL